MDPAFVESALGSQPVSLDRTTAILRGAFLPVLVPLAALTPVTRASWLLPNADVEISQRVSAALEAGLDQQAWSLIAHQTNPLIGRIDLVLSVWNARELARLGLPAPQNNWILVVAKVPPPGLETDAGLALSAVREMFSSLGWPRWSGPLLIVAGNAGASDPAPGLDAIVRPALPVLRARQPAAGVTPGEDFASRLCAMTLALTAPPAHGWPAWLEVGLEEVAKAKARGEGPSPLKMLAIRQRAGTQVLQRLLEESKPDPVLCEALCAPLVHTKRRPELPNFLDLLRHQVDVPGALHLAYNLSIDQLVTER